MRDPKARLLDILEAIDRIEKYAQLGQLEFEQNELIQNWFIHHIQIIGEAAFKTPLSFRELHPDIP